MSLRWASLSESSRSFSRMVLIREYLKHLVYFSYIASHLPHIFKPVLCFEIWIQLYYTEYMLYTISMMAVRWNIVMLFSKPERCGCRSQGGTHWVLFLEAQRRRSCLQPWVTIGERSSTEILWPETSLRLSTRYRFNLFDSDPCLKTSIVGEITVYAILLAFLEGLWTPVISLSSHWRIIRGSSTWSVGY